MDNLLNQSTALAKTENQPESLPAIVLSQQTNLSDLISDEAKALGYGDLPEQMKQLEQSGFLAEIGGLAQIKNRCGDSLFAGVRVSASGDRTIVFRQRYQDGGYSPEFWISQEALLIVAMYEKTRELSIRKEAIKSLQQIRKAYLRKLNNNEILNIPEALSALADVLKKLPVVSEEHELSAVELYHEIISILDENESVLGKTELALLREEKRGYLILEDDQLSRITSELKIPQKQLLELLKRKNLLYLTGSCRGYQCKVPYGKDYDGSIKYAWAYCLYDLEYLYKRKEDKCPPATIAPFDEI